MFKNMKWYPIIAAIIPPYIIIGSISIINASTKQSPFTIAAIHMGYILAIYLAIMIGVIIGSNYAKSNKIEVKTDV